jgi:hypothetical protein
MFSLSPIDPWLRVAIMAIIAAVLHDAATASEKRRCCSAHSLGCFSSLFGCLSVVSQSVVAQFESGGAGFDLLGTGRG